MLLKTAAISCTLFAAVPSIVHAQQAGEIRGRVLDQTGAVLQGVTIDLVVDAQE